MLNFARAVAVINQDQLGWAFLMFQVATGWPRYGPLSAWWGRWAVRRNGIEGRSNLLGRRHMPPRLASGVLGQVRWLAIGVVTGLNTLGFAAPGLSARLGIGLGPVCSIVRWLSVCCLGSVVVRWSPKLNSVRSSAAG